MPIAKTNMMHRNFFPLVLLAASVAACSDDSVSCTDIAVYSVTASVVNASGSPLDGATVSYSVDGGQSTPCEKLVPGTFNCGVEKSGTFTIVATYAGKIASATVAVDHNECHVITQKLTLTLQ
jgi:hypothetical protein